MKEMVECVDRCAGGPGQGWLQIAYSPSDAWRIIEGDKLAVILGGEVDSQGNWHNPQEVDLFVSGRGCEVEDAWETGVRYRLDRDGDDLVDSAERTIALSGAASSAAAGHVPANPHRPRAWDGEAGAGRGE